MDNKMVTFREAVSEDDRLMETSRSGTVEDIYYYYYYYHHHHHHHHNHHHYYSQR